MEGEGLVLMKISKITTQKRKKDRYNIFIDQGNGEEYGFSVDEEVLIKYHLRKGLQLDDELVRTLKEQDSIQKSYAEAISYLGYRMRSEKEMRDYLMKKDVDREQVSEIVQRLLNEGYVDDEEFAEMFVRNRINLSAKGPSLVKQELMQKGVSSEIAERAAGAYTYEVQYEKAANVAEKRMRRSSNHSHQKQLDQLRANLMRNGFTSEIINDVLAEVEELDPAAEWESLVHHGDRLLRRHQSKFSGNELENKLKDGLLRQGFSYAKVAKFIDENLDNNDSIS